MKQPLLWFLTGCLSIAAAQEKADPASALAPALRRFDRDRDGRLNDAELREARQMHNRGGRDAEPTARKWRDILERREKEFTRERLRDFDLNKNGKLDDSEQRELRGVWKRIAEKFTKLRSTITSKYDRNDDGELNEPERNASRSESDRLRREIEDQCVKEWKTSRSAPAA